MPQDVHGRTRDTIALVALGSNATSEFGSPSQQVSEAFNRLPGEGVGLLRRSALYHSPCFPTGSGPDYVNAAGVLVTTLSPQALLARLHRIEAEFGRARQQRWGMRTLDLDLLAFGDEIVPDAQTHAVWRNMPVEEQVRRTPDRLILPHPRLQDRAFVLVPLAEIAPDWQHPVTGLTVARMLAALPDDARVAVRRL
jgi:2-amino-4-hydroxy-6-hydroxymethyldihydropteridine diphosphokinase